MNPSGRKPLDVKVIVRPIPVQAVTSGGIHLPDKHIDREKYATTEGVLIASGPNAYADWGADNAPTLGAVVTYGQYCGARFKGRDGEEYWIMNDEDVIAEAAE